MHSPDSRYEAALEWLYARHRGDAARDPKHMRALMTALNLSDPPASVHVVGTNGKGTVSTMLATGLRSAGERAGLFLSPHVEDFRERISVNGTRVSRRRVERYIAGARADPHYPAAAFFEHTLVLALEVFREANVTAAVIEAGVGGAHDATRALEGVRLVVLTNVSLDHVATLGPTIADIARDKAGAIRPDVPIVTGAAGEALAVVRAEARRLGAPLYLDQPGDPLFEPPSGSLLGVGHARLQNGRQAAAALRLLGHSEKVVAAALAAEPLPARAERFPLGDREVLLDGAHDPAAAASLADDLQPGYVLLFGALARKSGAATLAQLEPKASHVLLTEASPGQAPLPDPGGRRLIADPSAALAAALALTPAGGRLVIAGSLYLAGALRSQLRERVRQADHRPASTA